VLATLVRPEDRSAIVFTWKFVRAWPARYGCAPLVGKGSHVAMEELVLAYERPEVG
jgi:hypothetical protein